MLDNLVPTPNPNQVGADEGFREYLWSPEGGMKYAIGALATARYGRRRLTTYP